ncbi:3'-5' exonuclease [Luteibacter sp. RCC_6_2]|uniref:3'-5' exonuclease n=1 Tax=Luteibacter sp. RCC_6_2 TaxID=3239223 RepID=UPI0035256213
MTDTDERGDEPASTEHCKTSGQEGRRSGRTPGRVWRERPSRAELLSLPRFPSLDPNQVIVAESKVATAKAAAALRDAIVLGFDTESRPVFQAGMKGTGPHLIQLASATTAVLFPITGGTLPPLLRELLEDARIAKVGFGLKGDHRGLHTKFGIRLRGGVEVSGLVQALGFRQRVGLQTAVAVVLGQHLVKSKRITTSNWAARPLQPAQIAYAAHDAMASLRVYQALRPLSGHGEQVSAAQHAAPPG